MLAKKTSKNQITLPKEIVKEFPDIEYFNVHVKDRTIVLTPVSVTFETNILEGIRDKMEKLGITKKDVDEAMKWARRKTR